MTTFPPPFGFEGDENIEWDGDNYYERACTAEEAELLEANQAAAEAEELAELTAFAQAQRDDYFGQLRAGLKREPGPDPTSSFPRKREPS
jgi:hypothetical protein